MQLKLYKMEPRQRSFCGRLWLWEKKLLLMFHLKNIFSFEKMPQNSFKKLKYKMQPKSCWSGRIFCIIWPENWTRKQSTKFKIFSNLCSLMKKDFTLWRSIIYKHNARWLHVYRLKASAVYCSFWKALNVNKTHPLKLAIGGGIWWVMQPHYTC